MNRLLIEIPTEFSSERLVLRIPKPGDGKAVFNAIQASLPELKPWMPFAQKEQSEHNSEMNVRKAYMNFMNREDLRMHLFSKDTGEFIGSSGLHRINWEIPKFEIGYWIDTRHSGKGYMTEAVQAISDFAFHELKARRVEIRCDSNNIKSRKIPERLSFTLEGILRNDAIAADGSGLRETCIYAKIK